jgi:hypothetical protein
MHRNLHRRVETCFPIEAARLRKRLMQEFEYYLEDNTNAWDLLPDGTYQKVERVTPRPWQPNRFSWKNWWIKESKLILESLLHREILPNPAAMGRPDMVKRCQVVAGLPWFFLWVKLRYEFSGSLGMGLFNDD